MNAARLAALSLLALVACSKPEAAPPLARQITGAAVTPLTDLNLVRDKIPPVLLAAQQAPYAGPAQPTCENLRVEIQALDAALGPDLDAPGRPEERSFLEKGRIETEDAAVGTLRSAAEALLPYRAWVRKLSGAERYSRQVTRAIAAGMVRRAYLKGLGQAQGCGAPPASVGTEARPAEPVPSPPKPPAP